MSPYGKHGLASENILQAINELGINTEGSTLEDGFNGGQCQVFRISFPHHEDQSLAVRVPIYMDSNAAIVALQTEEQNLYILAKAMFPWAPKCYGASLTFDNATKHPFIVVAWVDGSPLVWDESHPKRPLRDHVLGQMARIQQCLIECTTEQSM
ncbi:hypothetical protein LTR22_027502 [Elasticomyces elasticus]|nr:hypothetical protein LTR22_027502 [Elasticomyces elasticus]